MKKLLLTVITLLFLSGSYLAYDSYRSLQYLNRDLDWKWYKYHLMGHGIQTARTSHSHQLLLRSIDQKNHSALFVNTTLENKFAVVVLVEKQCEKQKSYAASLETNHAQPKTIHFICDDSGNALFFRQVWKKPLGLKITLGASTIEQDLTTWDLDVLKKDQFMQLHSEFFNKIGKKYPYKWSRD
jgi:hypothetical protein